MSTTLIPIEGRIEVPDTINRKCDYVPGKMHITSFSMGINRVGLSMKFDEFPGNIIGSHIQLNYEQVTNLRDTLTAWLNGNYEDFKEK